MKRDQAVDVDLDFDALMQRKSSTPTRSEYLAKLARERAYLETEIAKLSGKTGARQRAIRADLHDALTDSCAAMASILKGDWFAALQIRDQMHVRLHSTKRFQWAPDLQRALKFKRAEGSKNAKSVEIAAHVADLLRADPAATREAIYQRAERSIIEKMPRATFFRYVTDARKSAGIKSRAGRRK
ncbi:MAG: hypothetical protein ACYCT1_05100 [Steroidobacteraceae bacterium]